LPRLTFISELYYPEDTSTGYFVTGIAEGLASRCSDDVEVSVLCAQPSYAKAGVTAPKLESHRGVQIRRLAAPKGNKNRLPGRLWNLASLSFRFFGVMGREIRRGDLVVVLTNPPSLPVFAAFWGRIKGARIILLVHDVYPDVLVPTGLAREESLLVRSIDGVQRWMLRRMCSVVVLGRDMRGRLLGKMPGRDADLSIIPNWGEDGEIIPSMHIENTLRQRLGLQNKFIVQFSGNLGRTHGLDDLLALAVACREQDSLHFFVFGWGAGKAFLENEIRDKALSNITLLPPCEREELGTYLTCCDLFLMPFRKGMEGISVPSRLYNVLAAGNPVLAVADPSSELAQVVAEEQMGWVVEPGDIPAMQQAIQGAMKNREALEQMRLNARNALEQKYTRETVLDQWETLIRDQLHKTP
jgi:glycosyltransferase involved in cell wall biosynthesis